MGGPSAGYVCTTENTVIILIKVSSVIETYAYYFGDGNPNIPWCQGIELEKGMILPDSIFRSGCAAILVTNRKSPLNKYVLKEIALIYLEVC